MTIPLLKDVKEQAPQAICEVAPWNVNRNLLINREQAALRQSRTAAGDGADASTARPSSTSSPTGRARSAAPCMPPPAGSLGHAAGDAADAARATTPMSPKNRAEAREIMEKLGYGPDKRLDGQGVDAQHPGLPRSGGDPDRPAEGDLYRRRARADRHHATGSRRSCARTTRSAST